MTPRAPPRHQQGAGEPPKLASELTAATAMPAGNAHAPHRFGADAHQLVALFSASLEIFVLKRACALSRRCHMNNGKGRSAAILSLVIILIIHSSAFCAETIRYRKILTAPERSCLSQILRTGEWRLSPDFHKSMILAAHVARIDLNGDHRKEYIFIISEFASCGTAGCSMMIGQTDKRGVCREIYSGAGFEHATRVLAKRDHGYRRLYTPCEVRFNGRQYQQVREECPNAVVHH